MATAADNNKQTWNIAFDGIEQITLIEGPLGDDQLQITLSSADKVQELAFKCGFTESNPKYSRFGFGSCDNQATLFGPGSHSKLLDTLEEALSTNKASKIYQYTLPQK